MPKIKSHRGAAKRFWVTATGKVKHKKTGLRHLLTGMDAGRVAKCANPTILIDGCGVIKTLIP